MIVERTSPFAWMSIAAAFSSTFFVSSGTPLGFAAHVSRIFTPARCCSIVSCRSAAMRLRSAATTSASRRMRTPLRQRNSDIPTKKRTTAPRMQIAAWT